MKGIRVRKIKHPTIESYEMEISPSFIDYVKMTAGRNKAKFLLVKDGPTFEVISLLRKPSNDSLSGTIERSSQQDK